MNGNRRWLCMVLLGCLVQTLISQSQLRVQLVASEEHPFFGALEIQGLAREQVTNGICKVYTEYPNADQLPMFGKLIATDSFFYFQPRFPFIEGRTYWVALNTSETPTLLPIHIPEITLKTPPKVLAIYPSTAKWHANQLKFYIIFDQPMRFGTAYQHIQIVDENGTTLETPFLELEQELWNVSQTRLTVWFDPGRIKQLLIPNKNKGTPLNIKRKYRLSIRKDWLAINGLTLEEDYDNTFEVIPADHTQPKPDSWKIVSPKPNTQAPLVVHFSESMDYALLLSSIGVLNAQGEIISGRVEITDEEKSWHFYPTEPWESGTYTIRVSTDLEDLAGNNLERLFDSAFQDNKKEQTPEILFIDLKVSIDK